MKRSEFLKRLGIGVLAIPVIPKIFPREAAAEVVSPDDGLKLTDGLIGWSDRNKNEHVYRVHDLVLVNNGRDQYVVVAVAVDGDKLSLRGVNADLPDLELTVFDDITTLASHQGIII
jgi:hypothetical protein